MWITVFTTVFSGVIVYVMGQIIVKCALDPYISFKEHLGKISSLLLREQNKLVNVKPSSELINELKSSSGILIAKSKAIPCYDYFVKIRILPKYSDVIEASHHLNLISSMLEETAAIDPYSTRPSPLAGTSITKHLIIVGEKLDIVVSY